MTEPKPTRVDYRVLNPVCAYCTEPSTVIAVTQTETGDVLVRTMCLPHSVGEKDHCLAEGMMCAGPTDVPGAFTDSVLLAPRERN